MPVYLRGGGALAFRTRACISVSQSGRKTPRLCNVDLGLFRGGGVSTAQLESRLRRTAMKGSERAVKQTVKGSERAVNRQ